MYAETLIEEINLIAEAGDASDALDLVRTLTREENTASAIEIRRTVNGENLDRDALRKVASGIAQKVAASAAIFTPEVIAGLEALDAGLREAFRADAEMDPADRRARSAATWTANQRYAERVNVYNAQVEKVNRVRGRAANERKAAAVRAATCTKCFQVPAANGVCGC
ncbi:hypothetical protein ACFYSF_22570 [Streptomyces canus]|uniref:hypothetical protein n=1 Tax=Streptomyces canus TaxID=58343 RepID=UPI0036CA0500